MIQAARRISLGWAPRVAAKKKCKVDSALFRCQKCGTLVYEGVSLLHFVQHQEKYPDNIIIMERFQLDHILSVVALDGSEHSWDVYYKRLFCEEDNYRGLCSICHKKKSKIENEIRKKNKYGKKTR